LLNFIFIRDKVACLTFFFFFAWYKGRRTFVFEKEEDEVLFTSLNFLNFHRRTSGKKIRQGYFDSKKLFFNIFLFKNIQKNTFRISTNQI
jgi:hypothetical protein